MQYDTTDFVETNGEATMKLIARTRRLTREYYMTDHEDAERRRAILEELLGEIGKNVEIDTPFYCDYGKNIHIGSDVIINMNCTFVDNKPIRIGSKVLIASNVQIYTSSHPILPQERLRLDGNETEEPFFRTYALPVEIQDNVWIGGGVIILPGVTIGKNSVVGRYHWKQCRHRRRKPGCQGYSKQFCSGRQSLPGDTALWRRWTG